MKGDSVKPFNCIANRESFGRAVDIASFGGRPVEIEVGADRAVVRGTDPDLFLEVGFEGAVIVTGDCGTVSSRLFPTSYPRWREALDATSDPLETIEVDPNSLNRSLRLAVASFSGAGVRRVAEFTFVNGAIRIKARDDEFGSVVELPICRTGPDVSVDLPHSQLTEFLSHVSEPLSVTLGAAPASPVVFFVPGYRYAVSPITQ